MEGSLQQAKQGLRRQVLARLKQLEPARCEAASVQACALLQQQRCWRDAGSVLLFAPMAGELDVWPLAAAALAQGKALALPRYEASLKGYIACQVEQLSHQIVAGYYGIREPAQQCLGVSLKLLDLVLVPGVAFDLQGRRLGRGKGFYDRLLAEVCGKSCGVAFDQQLVDEVPVEPHDVVLNCILTPTRWLEL